MTQRLALSNKEAPQMQSPLWCGNCSSEQAALYFNLLTLLGNFIPLKEGINGDAKTLLNNIDLTFS